MLFKTYGVIYLDLHLLHYRVDVEDSTVAGTDDGLVLQNHNLSIKCRPDMTETVRVTQHKARGEVLQEGGGGGEGERVGERERGRGRERGREGGVRRERERERERER